MGEVRKQIKCANCMGVLIKVTTDGVAYRMPQFHVINFGGRSYLRLQCFCCGKWTVVREQHIL